VLSKTYDQSPDAVVEKRWIMVKYSPIAELFIS